ncbi:MAG TPA: tetratricopeptide repeat protein [Thermoanaerobaculaceae bacterium]|nr:tetratricopeptide repeat protein [Thermoanaerobaculaceae bacterium]
MSTAKRELIIQEAEQLAARGKLDAAIKQYKRAVDLAPHDTNALNRLGDLLVRVQRIPEAIDVYQRIADHFGEDGFFLKAIAIYKKVNRLDPRRTETYEHLANLYFKQGLVVEGRQQLLTLADWFLRSKQPDEAVRVYRRLVELEPSNFQARAKLVDLSVQRGDAAAVGEEIDALGRTLLSRNMLEEAMKLYHRALDLNPEHGDFIAPCVDALVSAGRQRQAAELARKALTATKGGLELKVSASRAFFESGDVEAARRLLEEVLPQSGGRGDVAQLYTEVMSRAGEPVEARDVLLPTIDRLLEANDLSQAATLVERLLKRDPRDADVLERALKVFDKQNDTDMVVSIGTALADVYFSGERTEEAAKLYLRLTQLAPSNPLFVQRVKELGLTPPASAAPEPSPKPVVATPRDEGLDLVEIDLSHVEAGPAEAPVPAAAAEPSPVSNSVEELFTEAQVFAKYGLTDKAVAHLERLLALDATHAPAQELLASLGGAPIGTGVDLGRAVASAGTAPPLSARDAEGAREALEAFAQPPAPPQPRQAPSADLSLPVPEINLGQLSAAAEPPAAAAPLPSFEGLGTPEPPAARTGDLRRTPTGAIHMENLEAMLGLREPGAAAAKPPVRAGARGGEPEAAEVADEAVVLVEVPGVLAGPGMDQLRELDFLIQQGLLDDAAKLLEKVRDAFPDHPDVTARQALLKARGWDEEHREPAAAASAGALFKEEEQFFDLAAELEKELAEEDMVAEATGAGKSSDVSIEQLFKEFQRGVAEQVQEEDYDTHFNLGLAYREMGLLDEAIGEFQLSAKSPEYLVESASMIAACFMEKGLPEQGAEWYARALTAPGVALEMELGLRYELGRAQEAAGNTAAALASFSEVLAINPAFRDVMDRVSKLRSN